MFWGLIMEPQRRYTQQVKKSFHVSMAALDVSTSSDEPAQVMCGFEGRNYLLCTLNKTDMLQCPLDLNFNIGSEVSFAANGKCHVHLTGYLTDELLDMSEEEDEELEDEEEVEAPATSKRSNKKSVSENGPPSKKIKASKVSSSQNEDFDSDSDVDVNALLGSSLDDSDDDSAVVEEEDEEDEEEDDEASGEEEEESSLSDDESEEEEVKVKANKILKREVKPVINGFAKKQETKNQKNERKKNEQLEQENKKSPKADQKKEVKKENLTPKTPKKKQLQGGVLIEDIKDGQGAPAKNGKFVNVYYEGRLKQNNKVFDATSKGAGFSFRLGNGEVIKGWDIGVAGMKPGGKRRITCPPQMAYGQKGSPPAIPPNSTLVFEVELKKIS